MKRHREITLLLLPALLFVGIGLLSHYHSQTKTPPAPEHIRPFKLLVNRVEFYQFRDSAYQQDRLPRQDPTKDVLRAYVFVDYEGSAPYWWLDNKLGRPRMWIQNISITSSNNKSYKPSYFQQGSGTDRKRRYDILVDCFVPKTRVAMVSGTFTATACIQGVGCVRFETPIHKGQEELNVHDGSTTPGIRILP